MSKSNILPFNDWFKVYESAGRNFNKSQQILESRMYRNIYNLYEEALSQTAVVIPDDIKSKGKINPGANITANISDMCGDWEITTEKSSYIYEKGLRLIDSIPGINFYEGGKYKSLKDDSELKINIFKLILAGIGNSIGTKDFASTLIGKNDLYDNLKLKSSYDKSFSLVGTPAAGSTAATVLTDQLVKSNGETVSSGDTSKSNPINLCAYLNMINLINWAAGDFTQYSNLSNGKNSALQGALQIASVGDRTPVSNERGILYLYTPTKPSEATEDNKPQSNASAPSIKGEYLPWRNLDTSYDDEGEPFGAEHPSIISLCKKIFSELGPNDVITKLQITSVVGTKWNGIATSGSGTGEPLKADNTKLTDETYKLEKTDLGNKWLAWKRGDNTAFDIYNFFGNRIKKNAIEILWKIADVDPKTGSNILYNIVSKSPSNSTFSDTEYVNRIKSESGESNNSGVSIYRYKISFDAAAVTGSAKSALKKATGIGKTSISYEDIEKGDIVKYKGKDDDGNISDKIVKSGEVISKDNNKPTILTDSGNKIAISKDRFISASGGTSSDGTPE